MDAKIGINGGSSEVEGQEKKCNRSFSSGGWLPVFATWLHGWWSRYGGLVWLGMFVGVCARNLVVGVVCQKIIDEGPCFTVFDVHST